MHYRGGLVAKTLLHRDFLKNYKASQNHILRDKKLHTLSTSSLFTVEGCSLGGAVVGEGGVVLTLLAAFVHGEKEAPTALGKKQNRKPHGWSHWKDWQSEASLDLWETVQHTYSWNQRRTKGMWWCSSSSHSASHPQNLDQCLEHGRCSINNSEKEKKENTCTQKTHSIATTGSVYKCSIQLQNSCPQISLVFLIRNCSFFFLIIFF